MLTIMALARRTAARDRRGEGGTLERPMRAARGEERFAEVGDDRDRCYQEMGDPDGEPMLLVMGLGTQMIAWDDGLLRAARRARAFA